MTSHKWGSNNAAVREENEQFQNYILKFQNY